MVGIDTKLGFVFIVIILMPFSVICTDALNCKPCPIGNYLVKPCNDEDGASICEPCPQGTFNEKADNSRSCEDCSFCDVTKVNEKECTSTSDTVCKCPHGHKWTSVGADGFCMKIR